MAIGNVIYTPRPALAPADVVDNLESTAVGLPLSANQGRLLHRQFSDMINSHRNLSNTDLLEEAKRFKAGLTPFSTSGGLTNVPVDNCIYSCGYVLGTPPNGIFQLVIFDRRSGTMYINPYYAGYSGWRKIEPINI